MARISTYQSDTSVEKDDKFLGSNFGGTTKNFAVQDIARFLSNTNAVNIAGQFTYQYKDETPYGNGTMRVSFSSGATFQNAGSIKISKFTYGETVNSSENILDVLSNRQILITEIGDQDNYGV